MADALISIVLKQLGSYVLNEVTLTINAHEEVDKLTENLKLVQAVLADADEKQVKKEVVRLWLDELKQVVYDADDVLDAWRTRTLISQIQSGVDVTAEKRKKVLSCLLSPCFCFNNAIAHYDIGHQIKDINQRLDVIVKQRIAFGLQVVEANQSQNEHRRLTSSIVDVSKVHGRDQAKEIIMSRLLGESSSHGTAHRVIAIVGVGGVGKTTLARFIFNQERVVEKFNAKMWACVSEPFDLVAVAKAIIKEAAGNVPYSAEWQEVHKCLCETIKGKHFLLVLDDVWTEDPRDWNQLKLSLDGGALGSRIIVTTRNQSVAKRMGCAEMDILDLKTLSDNDSWSVVKDVALMGRDGVELEEFEEVGREIAAKCKGIPLAIITLASLLREKRTKQEWKNVLSSDLWEMPDIKNFFLPSLFLSYYSLDPISKQCFLFCAVFPKDFEIQKNYLIRLWMAQGFFGYEERRDLERIGKNHFYILSMRSFFQDFKKDSDGDITSCKIHDFVHDFAIYLSQNEGLVLKAGDTNFDGEKIRHLSASDLDIPSILKGTKLRTLVLSLKTAIPVELFNRLGCLRTLVLRDSSFEVLPNEVGKLVHLRYLDLSGSELLELPETVCNLYNLQVLELSFCRHLCKLPKKIGMLTNLSHLEIEGTPLSYLPKGIAMLSSLRSLCKFIVSDVDDECTIGDLQLLNSLRGVLELKGLGRVTDESDIVRAELKKKTNLQKLSFHFMEGERGVGISMERVLEKLEPHEGLEKLEINEYPESQFPGWVRCLSLTNIVEMSLYGCNGCTELPAFGKLGSLKTLKIKKMDSVKRIGQEFYRVSAQITAFPKLKVLEIINMGNLEEWKVPISKDTKIMPLLVEIKLNSFPVLMVLPCLGRLESLEKLSMNGLTSVHYIGNEFYGFDDDSSLGVEMIAFPKLKTLTIIGMRELEEWEIPISKDRKIMPLVSQLRLSFCYNLRSLPRVWRMEALEELEFVGMHSVKSVGVEFVGVVDANERSLQDGITFPKLKILEITDMTGLEEWSVPFITPCLRELTLIAFWECKTLPTFRGCVKTLESLKILGMYSWEGQEKIVINDKGGSSGGGGDSCGLRSLTIRNCPLRVVPEYMFSPSIKELRFDDDVGALYNSFPAYGTLCSITEVSLSYLTYSYLPNGFDQLKALQTMNFSYCKTLDFDLKEMGHFTMLQDLYINECPLLKKRFEGDDWRTILAHVPKIRIDTVEITNERCLTEKLFIMIS